MADVLVKISVAGDKPLELSKCDPNCRCDLGGWVWSALDEVPQQRGYFFKTVASWIIVDVHPVRILLMPSNELSFCPFCTLLGCFQVPS